MRIVRDPQVAEELAQEAYIRALRTLEAAPIDHIEAFLHRTAHNLAIDHERRRKTRSKVEQFGVADTVLDAVADTAPSVEVALIEREQIRAFEQALADLPERTRRIMIMNRIERLTHAEIAERLGISASTVFNELKRGILRCRSQIEGPDQT